MTDHDSYDASLGQILNNVPDPISKRIIGSYKHTSSYSQNLTKINSSIFTYRELEQCAVTLNIKQHNPSQPDEKLFGNKKIVADRIILTIESHLPEVCDECNSTYCNKFGDDAPSLVCFLCLQGSHNCEAIQNKLQGYPSFAANKPTGFVWVCRGCRLKNNLADTKPKKAVKFQTSSDQPSSQVPAESDEEPAHDQEEENEEDRPSPRRNADAEEDTTQRICPLYKKNQCPHGASGKHKVDGRTCPNPHPRKCLKFCRYGNKRDRGCQKGRSCSLYHPILCKFSVRNGECRKRECTFTHLRHTKRPSSQRDDIDSSYPGRTSFHQNYQPFSQYDREFPPLRPRQRRDSNISAASSMSEPFRTPFSRSRPIAAVPAPSAARASTKDDSKVDFLVKLIENMKASFEKEIGDIKVRLPQLENQLKPPETLHQAQFPQMSQMLNPHPAPMFQWNPQYNQSSIY